MSDAAAIRMKKEAEKAAVFLIGAALAVLLY